MTDPPLRPQLSLKLKTDIALCHGQPQPRRPTGRSIFRDSKPNSQFPPSRPLSLCSLHLMLSFSQVPKPRSETHPRLVSLFHPQIPISGSPTSSAFPECAPSSLIFLSHITFLALPSVAKKTASCLQPLASQPVLHVPSTVIFQTPKRNPVIPLLRYMNGTPTIIMVSSWTNGMKPEGTCGRDWLMTRQPFFSFSWEHG